MRYEEWRISYQSSEQACRALWRENEKLRNYIQQQGKLIDALEKQGNLLRTDMILKRYD